MIRQFIQENFWNKTILASGRHNVEITRIELGSNYSTSTPFILCIFENEKGYFPLKINLKLTSSQNRKFVENLFTSAGLEQPLDALKEYKKLLNKKLSILIASCWTKDFGSGVSLNSFGKLIEDIEK